MSRRTWQQLLLEVETEAMKSLDFRLSTSATYLRILKMSDTTDIVANILMFLLISQDNFKHPKLRAELRATAHQLRG
jgi:hypothetical protein